MKHFLTVCFSVLIYMYLISSFDWRGSIWECWPDLKEKSVSLQQINFLSQAVFISWLSGKRVLKLVTILPLEFKFIQKTVYFGLQFCHLVRKFCIQIWNSVSDTIKSLYAFYNCKFREIGNDKATLFTPQCTWRDLCLMLLRDLIIEMKICKCTVMTTKEAFFRQCFNQFLCTAFVTLITVQKTHRCCVFTHFTEQKRNQLASMIHKLFITTALIYFGLVTTRKIKPWCHHKQTKQWRVWVSMTRGKLKLSGYPKFGNRLVRHGQNR